MTHPKLIAYLEAIWARPSFRKLMDSEDRLFAAVAQRSAEKTTQ